jgi:hypothetical protein
VELAPESLEPLIYVPLILGQKKQAAVLYCQQGVGAGFIDVASVERPVELNFMIQSCLASLAAFNRTEEVMPLLSVLLGPLQPDHRLRSSVT